jgi:hypothetical protein
MEVDTAASPADPGAEAARAHRDFGAGSPIACDRLVRIYVAARDRTYGAAR